MAETKWNFIIVGEQGVGKTSMMTRYVQNNFSHIYKATVAVDYLFKKIQVHGQTVNLHIWDSAGTEQFSAVCPQYFRIANGCILVYDMTRLTTFHKLSKWLSQFRDYNEKAPVIIVGNKSDDSNSKAVSRSVVKSYAEQEDMEYKECSAMTGDNIEEVFQLLVNKVWEQQNPPTSASASDSWSTATKNEDVNVPNGHTSISNTREEMTPENKVVSIYSKPENKIVPREEHESFVLTDKVPVKPKKKKCC